MVKRTLTDSKRAQLQELFSALDSDGGGEVEFEEFALAWKMMARGVCEVNVGFGGWKRGGDVRGERSDVRRDVSEVGEVLENEEGSG